MGTIENGSIFADNPLIRQVFDSVGSNLYILNREKKIVFVNRMLLKLLGCQRFADVLGKSAEELQLCECTDDLSPEKDPVHPDSEWSSDLSENNTAREKVIYSNRNGYSIPINVMQYVSLIEVQGEPFLVVTLDNVTDTVRRRMLERLFFHDIINTAGALKGLIQLVKDEVAPDVKDDIIFVQDSFQLMIDEIQSQKHIADAENDELILSIGKMQTLEIMRSVRSIFLKHKVAVDKDILIMDDSENVMLQTDVALVRRVLGNMLKNALEATERNDFIRMGCRIAESEEYSVEFWVNNRKMIPEDMKKHIFQQKFSSKSNERGLGTYGIKLITEKYLNGSVWFYSSEKEGTTFYVKLPVFYKPYG